MIIRDLKAGLLFVEPFSCQCSASGLLPAEIGGITMLQTLDLCGNQLEGELPVDMIRLKATHGCEVLLHENTPGFTLPAELDSLGDDIKKLDFSNCSLRG